MSAPFKLHGRQGSGSFVVQVALEEIGAPCERVWISKEAEDVAVRPAIQKVEAEHAV
jgi:hypothetical protein